jgi:uncharacterized protein YbjT (DUF2867 family)
MKVLVIGATGGSGKAAVAQLLAEGHQVTALVRRADAGLEGVKVVQGDVMKREDVARAVKGQDAVVVTLGIRENPIRVRLWGTRGTPLSVRSEGTRHVVEAMRAHGVRRLVVQSSYGVGETRNRIGWGNRLFFSLLLKPQIADTEVQEGLVRESGLDWTLVQPVHLTDGADDAPPAVSLRGDTEKMQVTRNSVGRFLAATVAQPAHHGKSIAVSGARSQAA